MKALVANGLDGGFVLEDIDIAAPIGREVLVYRSTQASYGRSQQRKKIDARRGQHFVGG